jgi:hypothetical protein
VQGRVTRVRAGRLGRAVDDQQVDLTQVGELGNVVPLEGLAVDAQRGQRGLAHLGDAGQPVRGQQGTGPLRVFGVVVQRDQPAAGPLERVRDPHRRRAAAELDHEPRLPHPDQVDQLEQVRRVEREVARGRHRRPRCEALEQLDERLDLATLRTQQHVGGVPGEPEILGQRLGQLTVPVARGESFLLDRGHEPALQLLHDDSQIALGRPLSAGDDTDPAGQ